jgi:hypothetical protein
MIVSQGQNMPRGGYREGSGGKPKWIHGKTKTIRVPEILADQILQYARELDEGKIKMVFGYKDSHGRLFAEKPTDPKRAVKSIDAKEINSMLNIVDLSGIPMIAVSGEMGVKLSDLVKRGYQLLPKRINDIVLASNKSKNDRTQNR